MRKFIMPAVMVLFFILFTSCGVNIFDAAGKGDTNKISEYLKSGLNVNATNMDGETGLIIAAKSGRLDAVKQLMDADADINITDIHSNSAIKLASDNGYADIIRLLGKKLFPSGKWEGNNISFTVSIDRNLISSLAVRATNGFGDELDDYIIEGPVKITWKGNKYTFYFDGSADNVVAEIIISGEFSPGYSNAVVTATTGSDYSTGGSSYYHTVLKAGPAGK